MKAWRLLSRRPPPDESRRPTEEEARARVLSRVAAERERLAERREAGEDVWAELRDLDAIVRALRG